MLTPRLQEVLQLLADGQQPKQIGADLHITLDTVRSHMFRIRELLNARSAQHAVAIGLRKNLIQ